MSATHPLESRGRLGARPRVEEMLPVGTISRLDSLTGLRWFAAFAVFLHHVQNLASIHKLEPVLKYGTYGVTFFFVLSGFVLTWSSRQSTGAPTFYWRRFARIWPSHFVALLLAIPVFYSFHPDPAHSWEKPISVGILLLSVPLLQAWWSNPTILFSGNPAAWTLTCEFFFYAVTPWIMKPFRRLSARGALTVATLIFVLEVAYREGTTRMPGSWLTQIPQPVTQLPAFVIGMCLAVAMRRGWTFRVLPVFTYLATGGVVVLLAATTSHADRLAVKAHHLAPELMVLVCAAMIASVASRDVNGSRSALRTRFWVRLGEWSFCFYLVHATVIYLTRDTVGAQSHGWAITLSWWAAMLAASLLVTAALHFIVERPFERRLRTRWDAKLAERSSRREARGAEAVA